MKKVLSIVAVLLCSSATAVAAPNDSKYHNEENNNELEMLITNSSDTLKRFTYGNSPRISDEVIAMANCIAVFPKVTKASLVVGGTHGDGVVSCKSTDNEWSRVGFVDLRGASLGAQIGVKQTEMIVLFNGDNAFKSLKEGRTRFGTDVGYSFGDKAKQRAVNMKKDVVVYSSDSGAFAEASLDGSYIVADEDELKDFYRENTTLEAALTARATREDRKITAISELLELLPNDSMS